MTKIKKNPLYIVLLLAFAVAAGCVADDDTAQPDDRQQMEAVATRWLDAYSSGDLDGIMAIMHEDAIVMPHNQPTVRGIDDVREFFASRIGRPGVNFIDDLQEIDINGNWAFVRGAFRVEIDTGDADNPYVHNGRYLVLYEKVGGEWKMLRDMDNLDPSPN